MKLDGAYFRLQNIIRALEGETGIDTLDPLARSILMLTGERQLKSEDLFVTDIISQPGFGAAMTVLTRMRDLERDGWIELKRDSRNHRRKRVTLTERGSTVLNRISDQLRTIIPQID